MNKIKKGDTIQVMRGKDAGKRAEVLKVLVEKDDRGRTHRKVVVQGVNVVKRAQKPNSQFGIQGGIVEFEKPIDISNVMLVDPKTDKPTRAGFRKNEKTNKFERISKKSNEVIK